MARSFHVVHKNCIMLFLCIVLMTACTLNRQARTVQPSPTETVTPSPASTNTPPPSPARTQMPSQEPATMPVWVTTPQAAAEDYQLKPWDYSTAMRIYDEARDMPITEEYSDLRSFYQLSLLEELYLSFPNLLSDSILLRDLDKYKGQGFTYSIGYGFIHDYSVESFRLALEQALNSNKTQLPELELWGEIVFTESDYSPAVRTTRLFEDGSPATVLKISANGDWDFFVLRENSLGGYSVFTIYPEWKQAWWNDETFQITDLNANGREEIAITYEGWGTGMSQFCKEKFFLYEWDGQNFTDLIITPIQVGVDTNLGYCLGITFQPDSGGRKLIRAGISKYTYCDEEIYTEPATYPYLEPVIYHWNGIGFSPLASPIPLPPEPRRTDKCTVGWALAAGPDNDAALKLLTTAVAYWPLDAEEVWGPAAHDYLKMKLAIWYLHRGEVQRGIHFLEQLQDSPDTPEYALPSQIASTFLETHARDGFTQAITAANQVYEDAMISFCEPWICDPRDMLDQLGFIEPGWDYINLGMYPADFGLIDSISLDLNINPPTNLLALQSRLIQMGQPAVWAGEADMDGQGPPDWLVDIDNTPILFLRQDDQLTRINFDNIYIDGEDENNTHRWETFQPITKSPIITVFQIGSKIIAFHLIQEHGIKRAVIDLFSSNRDNFIDIDPVEVQDWSIQAGRLIVQYDGIEGIYVWDDTAGTLIPTGYAPDILEENVSRAEQAIFLEDNPDQAIQILTAILKRRIPETYIFAWYVGYTNPPRLRPYIEYLLGLAYERSGDSDNAARTYWQLWQDYPSNPYSFAAQSKLKNR